jgi:hypothetical protein
MTTAYHLVHYRQFSLDGVDLGGSTLEALCRDALNLRDEAGETLWQRPSDRAFFDESANGRTIFLNKVADLSSAVFGEMCLAQTQDLQALLELSPTTVQLSDLTEAVVYDLDERYAPSGSQFVRGLAYWLAIGNHLFFVKTHSMSPELIRAYFHWLLNKTGVISVDESGLKLQAEFDRALIGDEIGDIRNLRVTGKASPQLVVSAQNGLAPARTVSTSRKVTDKIVQYGQAVPLITALLGPARADALVESLGDGEYLAVDASVRVRGRRTEQSREALRSIASDVADMTDAKVMIEGKYGKIADGDAILRTKMPFQLSQEGSNLLEFDNVADQLQEVYSRFVSDKKIKA